MTWVSGSPGPGGEGTELGSGSMDLTGWGAAQRAASCREREGLQAQVLAGGAWTLRSPPPGQQPHPRDLGREVPIERSPTSGCAEDGGGSIGGICRGWAGSECWGLAQGRGDPEGGRIKRGSEAESNDLVMTLKVSRGQGTEAEDGREMGEGPRILDHVGVSTGRSRGG